MKSKVPSGVIALAYLIGAYWGDGGGTALKAGMFLKPPAPCGLMPTLGAPLEKQYKQPYIDIAFGDAP